MNLAVLNVLWQIAGYFLQPYAELLPRLVWGGVAICYLVLLVLPAKGPVGRVFSGMFLVALLCLHVAGVYLLMTAGVSLEWILALLLASAVVGVSLGDLRGGGRYTVMLCLCAVAVCVLLLAKVPLWMPILAATLTVLVCVLARCRKGGRDK